MVRCWIGCIRGRNQHIGVLTGILLLLLLITPSATHPSDRVIKAIEVEGLTRMKEEDLIDLICLHEGDRLDREVLGRGIRRAFKKGIFLDIKAVAEDYEDGVRLKYIVEEVPLVRDIIVHGNLWVSTGDIRKAFLFKEGRGLREEFLQKARRGLITFFHRKGFINAEVDIRVVDAGRNKRDIIIDVNEGAPLIIKRINAPPEVMEHLTLREGSILDMDVIEQDIREIEGLYRRQGYINPVVGPYKFHNGELIIPVKKGDRLEVLFRGNTVFSTKGLLRLTGITEYKQITEERIEDMVNVIKRHYMKNGYPGVEVAAGIEREEGLIRLKVFISEGRKVVVRGVRFAGASLSQDVLKRVVLLKAGGPYNPALITESVDALKRFYNALGYIHMGVDGVREYPDQEGGIEIEFLINEGPRVRIGSIEIRGNASIDEHSIRDAIRLKPGSPYNTVDIGDARYRVLSLYRRNGFLDAEVRVRGLFEKERAELEFVITEGIPSHLGKVIIRGNRKTKDEVIMRQMGIREGQRIDYDELMRIREALFKLDLFDELSIDLLPPYETDGRLTRDMLITVKEAKPGSVDVAIGYGDYEQLRGSVQISYRNLGGYNRRVGLGIEMNAMKSKYNLSFREPWLFNIPELPLSLSLVKEDRRVINLDTKDLLYKVKKLSFIASTERQLRSALKAGLSYEYSFVKTTDVAQGVILSREDTGTVAISSISPSLFYDKRDDPFDPSSGSLNGIILKFASKALLSEAEFIKMVFQSSWYTRLHRGVVPAFSVRGGVAHAFGETEELPLIERFFLGGRNTVRGYSHDTLGPKGEDGSPTGGNVFALVNAELRVPLKKGLGVVTFIDGGNVWKVIDDVDAKLRYTIGVGLRYRTPVGPLRIDYGYKLDRLPDESVGELHFSIGHAF